MWLVAGLKFALFFTIARSINTALSSTELGWGEYLYPIGITIGLIIVQSVATTITETLAGRAETELRRIITAQLFNLGVSRSRDTGRVISLMTSCVEKTAQYRASFLGPIIGSVSAPLVVLALIALVIDPLTAAVLTVLLLLVPFIVKRFQSWTQPVGEAYRASQAKLTSEFLESIQALPMLVYNNAAQRSGDRLDTRSESHRQTIMRLLSKNQLLIFVVDASFYLSIVLVATALAVVRLNSGAIDLTGAITILLATILIVSPIDLVGSFFYIGIAGRGTQSAISGFLRAGRPAHSNAGDSGASHDKGDVDSQRVQAPGSIVVKNLSADWATTGGHPGHPGHPGRPGGGAGHPGVTHKPGDHSKEKGGHPGHPGHPGHSTPTRPTPARPLAVNDVSFDVSPGEIVALVGPSGCGKSTISAVIQGHLKPQSGEVFVDGFDLSTTDPHLIRRQLAVIEQRTFLFMGTIADNLRLAAPDATDEQLWNALELAELAQDVRAFPQGLETTVGDQGASLSGGQAQRLAIARAALRDAPIVIMDEPTSQVDLAAESAILSALKRLADGRTILMIAHREGAIMHADRVITMSATSAN